MQPRQAVWRGRGAPRKQVPDEIKDLAESTYKTGKVGHVVVAEDEEDDAKELVGLLTSYANGKNKRMRIQREENVLKFEMVDKVRRAKKVAE